MVYRRLLEHAQLDVLAVEPNADMRAGFARNLPGVPLLAGTAADIPEPRGHRGFDAVFVAQVSRSISQRMTSPRHNCWQLP